VTGEPDSDAVKLRMGHTLGNVSDRYIFTESGVDRYVGRVVSGLVHTTIDFAAPFLTRVGSERILKGLFTQLRRLSQWHDCSHFFHGRFNSLSSEFEKR
jgi:hypothetical protein